MKEAIYSSFSYMFKDKHWKTKLVLIALFVVPSTYLTYLTLNTQYQGVSYGVQSFIFGALAIVLSQFFIGYIVKCTNTIINSQDTSNIELPQWESNFWMFFKLGLKRTIATLLLVSIPILLFVSLGLFKILGISFLLAGLFALLPATILVVVYFILLMPLEKIFCTNFELFSYFKWKTAIKLILANPLLYIITILMGYALISLQNIVISTKLPLIILLFIHPLICAYVGLAYAHLVAKLGTKD